MSTGQADNDEALVTELRFLAPGGERAELSVRCGPWAYAGDGVLTRPVTESGGSAPLVQRAVSPELAAGQPDAHLRLENEIRALLRLGRRYPEGTSDIVPRLVGYQLQADVPYLLCTAAAGEPLAGLAGRLLVLEDRQRLLVGLFRCLHYLAGAGVVHGGITPQTTRWAAGQVQLTGFTGASVAGEPVTVGAAAPWAAPGRRQPGGPAELGDDVWSAAMVAYHVVTGQPVDGLTSSPDLAGRDALAGMLEGTFAEQAAARPDAARLLRRLRVTELLPPSTLDDSGLAAGRVAFDEVRRRKQPPSPAEQPARRRPATVPRRLRHRRGIVAAGIAMFAVLSVVAAMLVVGV